jgi:hypothetical protein
MQPAPTDTAVVIQYWLTPTQYSTLELPPPTKTSIPELSMLDLIDQAFENGEITAEQRLLYLAYAMRERESLPIQFRGKGEWGDNEAILHLNEVYEVADNPTILCSTSPDIRSEIERLHQPHTTCEKPDPKQTSTPNLIHHAFALGEISAEQRLLYLAYAFFEYESLPVQFQSNVGWHGTNILGELEEAVNDSSVFCPMRSEIRNEIQGLLNPKITCKISDRGISTPELIEQAFAKDEIPAERRLLYLTYAVYDFKFYCQFRETEDKQHFSTERKNASYSNHVR